MAVRRTSFVVPPPSRRPAVIAMFLAGFLFAVMGLTTKMLDAAALVGRPLPASEVALFRFGFGVLVMLPLQGHPKVHLLGINHRGLLLRGIWGGLAVLFYFVSLQRTSLTHAQLLNYTSLIFAPIFARFVLRERFTNRMAGAITVALVGICLITLQGGTAGRLNVGDAAGLVSGIMAGAAITEVRRLRQSESAWSVFFYLCLVGIPIAAVAALLFGNHLVLPTAAGLVILLVMGVSSVGGQVLMTYGYKYVRAGEGNLITMTQVLYNAFAGAVVFHEVFTAWTAIGGGLILGAAIWLSSARVPSASP